MFSIDMGSISMGMLRNAQSVATGMVCLIRCLFPCQFADFRFADWETNEICGFAFCGLINSLADLGFADWHTSEMCGIAVVD
jgi:hypothetical protein